MEVDDDEMVVVIVSGETEELDSDNKPNIIKDPGDTGALAIEELIETATKHGEVLPLEFEAKDEPDEYLEEELLEDSSEEIPEEIDGKEPKRSGILRRRMLEPHQRKSYVKELRENHPELRADVNLLIERLCEDMRSFKPPPPPQDSFIMNGVMIQCRKCGALRKSMAAAATHYQDIHGPRYLKCFACGVDFKKMAHLHKHEKLCHAPDSTIVLKARARAVGRKSKGRPFQPKKSNKAESKTPSKKYKCQLCPAMFSYTSTLKSHMYIHSGTRPYKCDQCPAAYTSLSSLCYHKQTHKGLEYICDHCKRSFKMKHTLTAHMATHQPQRKFECEVCGRRYAKNVALKLHVNQKHLNLPLPCACQFCPKRYREMSTLKQHMEKMHGLSLMTRNMFYKKLPTLTETEFNEAIVTYKCDILDETKEIEQLKQTEHSNFEKNIIVDLEWKKKQSEIKDKKSKVDTENDVKVVIVKDGQVVKDSKVKLK